MDNTTSFHKNFRLNGKIFTSVAALLSYTKKQEIENYNFLQNWFNNDDFVIVKTSGSTGKPKPIKILKKHMINSAKATGAFFNLKENTTALLCLSPNYIAGKMMLVRALVLGWNIDIVAPKSNPLEGNKKQYDFTAMVPLQVQASLNELSNVTTLIVGGGAVINKLLNNIKSLKTKVYATYGMTETVTHIAIKKLNHCKENQNFIVLPNIKISKDHRDCLVIDAPKISNEIVVTNDIVEILNAQSFKWLGRFDTIINSGGIKIIPEQIEQKLTKIIDQPFFITAEKDEVLGEKLILIIEGKSIENLKNKIKDSGLLTKYELPKTIYFIDEFVRTLTSKIDRKNTLKLIVL